jgi:hypothetical protein
MNKKSFLLLIYLEFISGGSNHNATGTHIQFNIDVVAGVGFKGKTANNQMVHCHPSSFPKFFYTTIE